MSLETLNVLNGLSQVIGELCYDGAYDKEGNLVEIGLRREEGHPILDSRVMDGFNVKVMADTLCISYHMEDSSMKSVHDNKFESNIDSTISEVKSFIEKQFRKNTGKSLSLKESGEVCIEVNPLSRVRVQVLANKFYSIGALSEVESSEGSDEDRVDKSIRDFLSLKHDKKAKNDKSPSAAVEPFNPNKMKFGLRK